MIHSVIDLLKQFPDYIPGTEAALAVLVMAVPVYAGLQFFAYRRKLHFALRLHLAYLTVFVLFAGLAFILGTPLSKFLHPLVLNAYLILTCIVSAYAVVSLVDIFFIEHYLINVRKVYVSPPLRKVCQILLFLMAIIPLLHAVLHFNPLTLVAIPTIVTAGIALALQDTLKTFIAGVNLGNVIRIGQWIAIQDKEGQVIDINWARTVLRTMDGDVLMVPNSQLQTQSFTNFIVDNPHRMTLKLTLAYKASPPSVKQVLERCAQGVPGVAEYPAASAVILNYVDAGISYALYFWVDDYAGRFAIQDKIATRAWEAFRHEGFELPLPFPSKPIQEEKDRQGGVGQEAILRALGEWDLGRAFSAEGLAELARWAQMRSFLHGEIIVQEGEPGDSLFIIVDGTVEVIQKEHPQHPIAVLKKAQVFGEMSLLTGALRNATVRAQGPVELAEIGKVCLQRVLSKNPEATERLAALVAERQVAMAGRSPKAAESEGEPADRSLSRRIRKFLGV